MYAIIDFVLSIFNNIVNVLNIRIFDDIPITFLQLILSCIAIKYVFKFLFGGFKEIDTSANINLNHLSKSAYNLTHNSRKRQLVNSNSVNFNNITDGSFYYSRGNRNGYFKKTTDIKPNGSVVKHVEHIEM